VLGDRLRPADQFAGVAGWRFGEQDLQRPLVCVLRIRRAKRVAPRGLAQGALVLGDYLYGDALARRLGSCLAGPQFLNAPPPIQICWATFQGKLGSGAGSSPKWTLDWVKRTEIATKVRSA
jgi:hypothetical protein